MHPARLLAGTAGLVALALAAPLAARPGGWGYPGSWDRWDRPGSPDDPFGTRGTARNSQEMREGKVDVVRFAAAGKTDELGHGTIAVTAKSDAPAPAVPDGWPRETDAADTAPKAYGPQQPKPAEDSSAPAYEAAVVDQLVSAGYDTQAPAGSESQMAELHISRSIAQPGEAPHKPVSGEMEMGVSNRGTMMGMGLNIDLTKPKKALISTRLEARIRDKASGDVLWEGRADIVTRDGDPEWTEQAIAGRLAKALFDGFPDKVEHMVAQR